MTYYKHACAFVSGIVGYTMFITHIHNFEIALIREVFVNSCHKSTYGTHTRTHTRYHIYFGVERFAPGCEAWILSERENSKIGSLEMKYLRIVRGITRRIG